MPKQRGRPPLLADDQQNGLTDAFPHLTHRHRVNRWYADRAWDVIKGLPCAEYYRNTDTGGPGKVSLLTELGRLKNEEAIRDVADILAEFAGERRLSVKEAEKTIRETRRRLKGEGVI